MKILINDKGEPMGMDEFWDENNPIWNLTWWKRIWYPLCRAWDYIRYIPKEIKWFCQRGKRGWSDKDVWNMWYYLAEVIPQMVAYLKKTNHGYPGELWAKYTKELGENNEAYEAADKEWHEILETITDGFKAAIEMDDHIVRSPEYKEAKKRFDKGMKAFHRYFHDLWD